MKRTGGSADKNVLSAGNKRVAVLKMISGEKQQDVGLDIRAARKVVSNSSIIVEDKGNGADRLQPQAVAFQRPKGVDAPRPGTLSKLSKRDRETGSKSFDSQETSTQITESDDGERLVKRKKKKQARTESNNP